MKEEKKRNCIFCGSPIKGSPCHEMLHIHRWIRTPQEVTKEERTVVDLPTCASCRDKIHPFSGIFFKLAIYGSIFIVCCAAFSFYQRGFFSLSVLGGGGILAFLIIAGIAAFFTFMSFLWAALVIGNAFDNVSVKDMPYKNLPVVAYIIENGFVDENDECNIIINVDDENYTSFKQFSETIKNQYHLHKVIMCG